VAQYYIATLLRCHLESGSFANFGTKFAVHPVEQGCNEVALPQVAAQRSGYVIESHFASQFATQTNNA
jgi:hypothetical protein